MSYYFHFSGTPCLRHTNYTFYKAFKYKLGDNESKVLSLGDFFFLKILQDVPVCIGEIELLWEDRASNQLLASVRLYFRPEHTPDGRQDDTGQDEIVVLGERLVLRLDDLLPLMVVASNFKWEYGYQAPWLSAATLAQTTAQTNGSLTVKQEHKHSTNGHSKSPPSSPPTTTTTTNPIVIKDEDEEEEEEVDWSAVNKVDSPGSDDGDTGPSVKGAANITVMSYPRYCRYRAMMRRLEGCENKWLQMAVVMALGSFAGRGPGCRVMFCRDAFYHSEIDDLDIRMDHMMPTLKNRPRGKKKKELCRKDSSQHDSDSTEELFANIAPTISSSSRPRRSTDPSELTEDKVNAEEQAFLIGLHKFMHDAKIPIGRIPSLGFKQIDLYVFYKQAEKLGGYDAITTKRMWKHLYDKMGGKSSNTSAATCTRRHYERLLLPYERHLYKLKAPKAKKKTIRAIEYPDVKQEKKEEKENVSNQTEEKKRQREEESGRGGVVSAGGASSVKVEENLEGETITMATTLVSSTPPPPPPPPPPQPSPPPPPPSSGSPLQETSVNARGKSSSSSSSAPTVVAAGCHDSKNNDTELLEIPIVRQRHHNHQATSIPGKDKHGDKDMDNMKQQQQQQQQQHPQHHPFHPHQLLPPNLASLGLTQQQLLAGAIPGAVLPDDFGAAEGTVIPNTNLVYRGGYLVPLHPQQIMQTPWGLMAAAAAGPPPMKQEHMMDKNAKSGGDNKRKDLDPHNTINAIPSSLATAGGKQLASSKNALSADSMLFSGALSNNSCGGGANTHQKAAHTNTPYQPSPYLLTDHINNHQQQQQRQATNSSSSSTSSSKLQQLNTILASSSQNLITLLHPTPSGRKSHPNLPRAPAQVYLHPSSTNPLSPSLPSPNGAIPPPPAHSQPRKRPYPFDPPPNQGSLFPSPDIVLDRIKSSTGIRPAAAAGRPPAPRQKFDSPRDIFTQTKQTFAAATAALNNHHHHPSPSSHPLLLPHHHPHQQQQQQPTSQTPNHHQRKPPTHYQQFDSNPNINQKRPSSSLSSSSSSSKLKPSSSSSSSSSQHQQRKPQHPSPHHHPQGLPSSSLSLTTPSSSSSLYPMMPPSALDLQSIQQMQAVAAAAAAAASNGMGVGGSNMNSNNASAALREQMKQQQQQQQQAVAALSGLTNGLVMTAADQQALVKGGMGGVMPTESQLAAAVAAKEGHRLTSALFGNQFTAMPRPTSKQLSSDHSPSPSSSSSSAMTLNPNTSESAVAAAAAAAMSLNPGLHPAFMSPYLPQGVSPAALSPQIQMQMAAAYEELLRQNGYGAFMPPGGGGAPPPPPAKVGKKN